MTRKISLGRSVSHATQMTKRIRRGSVLLVSTFSLGLTLGACDGAADPGSTTTASDALVAALAACHLNDGSVDKTAEIRACTPAEEHHKTTICHIPPGNPANAHTLCIGNAAVPAHLENHGDYLGPCKAEQPCPPPPSTGTGGAGIGGQTGQGTGGASGAPAGGSTGSISIG